MTDDDQPADRTPVDDPHGERWHRDAAAEWARASKPRARKPYQAPDLPDFGGQVDTSLVTREVLGRFIQDRDTGVVHDAYAATTECGIDVIRNGTWWHFWSEVAADPLRDVRCPHCLPE